MLQPSDRVGNHLCNILLVLELTSEPVLSAGPALFAGLQLAPSRLVVWYIVDESNSASHVTISSVHLK